MRDAATTNIGALSAIPFLLSLMAFAGFLYAGNLLIVISGRDDAAKQAAQAENSRRAATRAAESQQTMQQLQQTISTATQDLERLRSEKIALEDKLRALQQLAERVAQLRLSRSEAEERATRLTAEIDALKQQLHGVQREIEEKDQVHAQQLVPSGSRRPSVFVECDAQGIWLMPDRTPLDAAAPSAARETFLSRVKTKGYVVFLIRPNGFTSFERYREILTSYNATAAQALDFGYEPVNAEWKLAYPTN